jgi:hypothetical protein
MKIRLWLSVVLLGVSLTLLAGPGVAALPPQTPEPPDEPLALSGGASEEYPFDLKEIVSHSTVTAAPQGGIIDIATDDGEDESDPAVALCAYDQYLVVYERGGEIYGQRLENDGDLLGSAFLISGDAHPDANPDVACDWYYNRFVVVWDHDFAGGGTDYDVRARGVYGGHQTSGSQLYGSELSVSEDGVDEQDPAIACNSDGHTCLVVFEYSGSGNGDVYGQRVSVGSADISLNGDRFNVSGFGVEEYNPDVAWGGCDDDYLVVWQYLHNDPSNHYRIVLAYVWDTNQAGSQIETGGSYLIAQGSHDHHQTMPAAAYNRDTRQYLAAFQYDWNGDGSDYDILALRLTPGGGSVGNVFFVAGTSPYDETSPAVAFSGGTQSISGGMGANQFLVTYIYESDTEQVIYGQAVKGTYYTGGDQRDGGRTSILSTGGGPNFGLFNPDVTGSINNGRYMVVWEDMTGGFAGDDYDVLGRMVAPYTVYLPLVLNDSSG